MEASCSSSRFDDQSTEDFCFEVPIINVGIKEPEVEVLLVSNAETSNNVTNSETIVIEETEAITELIDVQKEVLKEDNSIVIDDEEQVNINDIDLETRALNITFNEIINKNNKNLKDDTIDLDKETDNVTALNGNRTDSDVIILDGNKTDSDSTIILNDDEINEFTKNKFQHTDVIDVEKDTDCSIVNVTLNTYNKTEKEFKDLIQKCLSMKNSAGMTRVINRTLLVIYKDVDENCKKSDEFKKVIANTSTHLDAEPERKFSHIKNLCDWLKQHKIKKKVPFITLNKRKDKGDSTIIPNKRSKVDIIDLVDDSTNTQCNRTACKPAKNNYTVGRVYPSIDLDSSDGEVIENDDVILLNKENKKTVQNRNYKKPNIIKKKNYEKPNIIKKKNNEKRKVGRPSKCPCDKPNTSTQLSKINDPAMLLEPRMSVRVETAEETRAKINDIEARIAHLKSDLQKAEEAEVLNDDCSSPYLICEQIKETILKLYKQLCQITGTEATKRHEVRLQVVPGHAEGPVRCLEEFLNANIDEDGNPPFPDMSDVMQCVFDANYKYNLRWTSSQIFREAQALFTQFGQSMQKRRQKREWKDMMSLVKSEVIDPADEDPALQARLEENKRIAKRKEMDLLDRFAKIEFGMSPALEQDLQVCSSSERGLLRVDQSEESDEDSEDQYPYDNDYGDLYNSRSDTENASKTVNGESFGTATKNNEYPLKIATPTMIQVRSFETATKNNEHPLNKATPTMIQVRGFETVTKNNDNPLNIATPTMIQVRSFETATKNTEDSLNKVKPSAVQIQGAVCVSGNGIISNTNKIVDNVKYGTTLNASNSGKIVIQPTIQYLPDKNTSMTPSTNFSSEYNRFINTYDHEKSASKVTKLPQNHGRRNTKSKPDANHPKCNETDIEKAAKFAQDIISLVQSDLFKNCLANDNSDTLVRSRLDLNDLTSNTNLNTNPALTSDNGNNLGSTTAQVLTHTTRCENVNINEITQGIEPNKTSDKTSNVLENEMEEIEAKVEEQAIKPESLDVPGMLSYPIVRLTQLDLNSLPSNTSFNTNHSALTSDNLGSTTAQVLTHTTPYKNVNTNEITQSIEPNKTTDTSNVLENEMEEIEAKVEEQAIKPEPLDIPSMLEELGEGFTATIFDIEDPFLVIEISDSSESEEENLEDA